MLATSSYLLSMSTPENAVAEKVPTMPPLSVETVRLDDRLSPQASADVGLRPKRRPYQAPSDLKQALLSKALAPLAPAAHSPPPSAPSACSRQARREDRGRARRAPR